MTIRALLLLPNDTYEIIDLDPDDLPGLQRLVGGHLESLRLVGMGALALLNEDGKRLALPLNWRATEMVKEVIEFGDIIVGPVVVVGDDGGPEMRDVPQGIVDLAESVGEF